MVLYAFLRHLWPLPIPTTIRSTEEDCVINLDPEFLLCHLLKLLLKTVLPPFLSWFEVCNKLIPEESEVDESKCDSEQD